MYVCVCLSCWSFEVEFALLQCSGCVQRSPSILACTSWKPLAGRTSRNLRPNAAANSNWANATAPIARALIWPIRLCFHSCLALRLGQQTPIGLQDPQIFRKLRILRRWRNQDRFGLLSPEICVRVRWKIGTSGIASCLLTRFFISYCFSIHH